MKRLLLALLVAALLIACSLPAFASQSKPLDPTLSMGWFHLRR